MRQTHYRPGHTRAIATDAEKDRLNQIFTYHGGKALPADACHPVGDTPFEIAERKKESQRLAEVRQKYSKAEVKHAPVQLSHKENLANQITGEINERCEYLKAMQELNADSKKLQSIKADIASKVNELKRLESSI